MNKYEEALDFLFSGYQDVDVVRRVQRLEELVTRATPMEATWKIEKSLYMLCPVCDSVVFGFNRKKDNFCSNCGQAIDYEM